MNITYNKLCSRRVKLRVFRSINIKKVQESINKYTVVKAECLGNYGWLRDSLQEMKYT